MLSKALFKNSKTVNVYRLLKVMGQTQAACMIYLAGLWN